MYFNCSFSFNGPIVMWIIDWMIYRCKKDIKLALDIIDDDFGFHWDRKRHSYANSWVKPFDVGAWFSFLVALDTVSTSLVLFSRYVYILVWADEGFLSDHLSYLWANPFTDKMNSFTIYTILYMLQSFFYCLTIIKGSAMPILALIICGIYYNQFVYLACAMDYDSRIIEKLLDNINTNPECRLKMLEKLKIKNSLDATFNQKFVQHLQRHRTLLK